MLEQFDPAHEARVISLLQAARRVAVVGAKDKAGQPVDGVGRYLIEAGLKITPVHPVRATVWGLPVRTSILELDPDVDIIDLFRAATACPEHARETLTLIEKRRTDKPLVFWMQSGIDSAEAREILAHAENVVVVADRCLMVAHRQLPTSGAVPA